MSKWDLTGLYTYVCNQLPVIKSSDSAAILCNMISYFCEIHLNLFSLQLN